MIPLFEELTDADMETVSDLACAALTLVAQRAGEEFDAELADLDGESAALHAEACDLIAALVLEGLIDLAACRLELADWHACAATRKANL